MLLCEGRSASLLHEPQRSCCHENKTSVAFLNPIEAITETVGLLLCVSFTGNENRATCTLLALQGGKVNASHVSNLHTSSHQRWCFLVPAPSSPSGESEGLDRLPWCNKVVMWGRRGSDGWWCSRVSYRHFNYPLRVSVCVCVCVCVSVSVCVCEWECPPCLLNCT